MAENRCFPGFRRKRQALTPLYETTFCVFDKIGTFVKIVIFAKKSLFVKNVTFAILRKPVRKSPVIIR